MLRTLAITLALLGAATLPLVATAAPTCIPGADRPDLVCVEAQGPTYGDTCVFQSTNPPYPGTWQSSTTCLPMPCPPWLCADPIKLEIVSRGGDL